MSGSLRIFPTDTAVGGVLGTTHFDGFPVVLVLVLLSAKGGENENKKG
jgi:hypothetical protein